MTTDSEKKNIQEKKLNDIKYSKLDWKVLDSYFSNDRYYLSKHHLNSYNHFVRNNIPYVIKALNPITILKNDETTNNLLHRIDIYMGGKNHDKIYFGKPFIADEDNIRVLYPNEARLKDYSYLSELTVDVLIEYIYAETKESEERVETKEFKNVKIGMIPIMLHSEICVLNNQKAEILKELGECPYDQGGYFIIHGKEKVLIAQERTAVNKLFIVEPTNKDKFSLIGEIRCTPEHNTLFPKALNFGIYSENYSNRCPSLLIDEDDKVIRRSCRKNAIVLTCPNIVDLEIPVFLMFRALGVESDKKILEYIVGDLSDPKNKSLIDFLRYSIVDGNLFYTQKEAIEYLAHNAQLYPDISDYVRYIIANDFLPNLGINNKNKALFLGYIVNKLVRTKLGLLNVSNRDNYIHKRVDLSGILLTNLFRDFYNDLRNNINSVVDNVYTKGTFNEHGNLIDLVNKNNFKRIFDHKIIEDGLIRSLKGQWGREQRDEDSGIVQDLDRISYLAYISHIRRICNPMDPSNKLVEPHRLYTSQYGFLCPIESPDGANIGLLKNLSILCSISEESKKSIIEELLVKEDIIRLLKDIYPQNINPDYCKIFINNNWYCITDKPNLIMDKLVKYRSEGVINYDVSLSWDIINNEINILCDAGRCVRPLYRVHHNKLYVDKFLDTIENEPVESLWRKLTTLDKNDNLCIEYIDVQETNTKMIAMNRSNLQNFQPYTNCEIHPSAALSVYTNTLPFPEKNPAARNVFSCQQGKQAIGVYATNFNNRIDTASYILHYPQRALIHTKYTKYSHNDELPNGNNVIVAIMCYSGYNQEDSVILNRASIERGLFNITSFKSMIEEENYNERAGEKIMFANPLKLKMNGVDFKVPYACWSKIDDFGFPKVNSVMKEEDIMIGRVKINTTLNREMNNDDFVSKEIIKDTYIDKSIKGTKIKNGTVDKVYIYKKQDNLRKVKIKMRKFRFPVNGDKFASRCSQKGVCGFIMDPENMPYTTSGLVPDMIINPHAIPSRMTISHLVETVLAKLCCLSSTSINATAFENNNMDDYYNVLYKKYGYNKYGNEVMYNGFTGEQIDSEIFIGPTYYYRLKHMVQDKINYVDKAKRVNLTKQPVKGRSNEGSLALGEMETNVMISNGLSSFMKEAYMEKCDKMSYLLNKDTGNLAFKRRQMIGEQNKVIYIPSTTEDTDENQYNNFGNIEIPYALKLLTQELEGLGIQTKFITNKMDEALNDEFENFDSDIETESVSSDTDD